jgi:hypothetical protein
MTSRISDSIKLSKDKVCRIISDQLQNCRGGNGRMEDWIIFFAWGGGTMSHPPVLLIEDDCAA